MFDKGLMKYSKHMSNGSPKTFENIRYPVSWREGRKLIHGLREAIEIVENGDPG